MDSAPRTLDHLIVRGTAAPEPFRPVGGGGSKKPERMLDRAGHAQRLLGQLKEVAALARDRAAEPLAPGLKKGTGTYVTFESAPGDMLAVGSLENETIGTRVLALRQVPVEGDAAGRVTAAVFVPEGKLDRISQKIEQYRDGDTPGGNPKNQPLVESIQSVSASRLSDLWSEYGVPFPDAGETVWWEVWLRTDGSSDAKRVTDEFRVQAKAASLPVSDNELVFPERIVLLVRATAEELDQSVFRLDTMAELRRARETAEFFDTLPPQEIGEWVRDARDRVTPPPGTAPAVTVLDTGVNRGHPLIEPALAESDMHAYHPDWSKADDLPSHSGGGHGTQMAGLSLYGDLSDALASNRPVQLTHRLESVRVWPPKGPNDPQLYGDVTRDGIAQAEVTAPMRPRVCLLTTSADGKPHMGQASSWSSAVDQLCYGTDEEETNPRLIVVAAGNASNDAMQTYPDGNEVDTVHDPGQAWNALTVGAFTERDRIDAAAHPEWKAVAPRGGLSPSSTTSVMWDHSQTPHKPDLVMEGGNYGIDPSDGRPVDHPPSLRLLTTYRHFGTTPVTTSGDTSGAAALAARLAARIRARYPNLWPEAVRALMVHSSRWTPEMLAPFDENNLSKQGAGSDLNILLRKYGYGVPDERVALNSARDSLTLVDQGTLRPFGDLEGSNVRLGNANFHRLPWPTEVLQQLPPGVRAKMRVTLSYFVEPNPTSAASAPFGARFQYASHGLRFKTQSPAETFDEFRRRVNLLARTPQSGSETSSDAQKWKLGPDLRTRGSVHSDWWEGSAAELAKKDAICVHPTSGWWKDRPHHERWNRTVRYALVVTIETPSVLTDIYTPVKNSIAITVDSTSGKRA